MIAQFISLLKKLFGVKPVVSDSIDYIPFVPEESYTTITPPKPQPVVPTAQEKLLKAALSHLGSDASPRDIAPDELACVESVWEVYKGEFGVYPNGKSSPLQVSTIEAKKILSNNPRFTQTLNLEPGNIIISVSGTGNGLIEHGHIGILCLS